MTKAKSQSQPKAARRGRGSHHAVPERWNRIFIIGGVVAVIVIAIGIIAFGWYQTQIKPLGKTVLQVGETKFSLGHLERRMRLMRDENPFIAQTEQILQLPDIVLFQLENEGKLLEGASEIDLAVTEEEIDAEIRKRGNLADGVEARVFAQEFRRQVDESGLKRDEYRQMLKADLLEEEARNYFVFLSPTEEEQVRALWMVLSDQEEAEEASQRLEAGEDFAVVAQDASTEVVGGGQDGDPSWSVRGSPFLPVSVEEFFFEAEPGEVSDVIPVGSAFYIGELVEREADRPLDGEQRRQVGNRNMGEWLLDMPVEVERNLTEEDAIRALEDIL